MKIIKEGLREKDIAIAIGLSQDDLIQIFTAQAAGDANTGRCGDCGNCADCGFCTKGCYNVGCREGMETPSSELRKT